MTAPANPYLQEIATLRARIEYLEAENLQLKLSLRGQNVDITGLSASERTVLGVLLARSVATREAVYNALYSDRIDDPPAQKVLGVMVCKLRNKLRPHRIAIETIWGSGWSMTPAMKGRVRALMARRRQDAEGA